jgi:NAD(P)H-quinone oxidoreductase subunit I
LKLKNYGEGIAKGMAVTMKNAIRTPITTQYPEKKLHISRRTRGNKLVWDKEKCIACSMCARACPVQCISMATSRDENKKLKVDKMDYDAGVCIFCGLCVEACPQKCLYMDVDYEKSVYSRKKLNFTKEDILMTEKSKPSGYYSPENEAKLPKQTLLVDGKLWDK